MKKTLFLSLVAFLFVATSCTNRQKTREEQVEEFRSSLTTEDSTTVVRLCDDAMELLKAKKIDEVIAGLYEYDDSLKEVKPLSEQMARRLIRKFKMFPVLDYERQYFSFMLEGCNDVKYDVTFATAEQAGTEKPATTAYMFNPVKIGGEWKLCVKTAHDEFDTTKR